MAARVRILTTSAKEDGKEAKSAESVGVSGHLAPSVLGGGRPIAAKPPRETWWLGDRLLHIGSPGRGSSVQLSADDGGRDTTSSWVCMVTTGTRFDSWFKEEAGWEIFL